MRLANYLTYRSSGFAFRLIVPADLQPVVGRRVVKKVLGTHDRVTVQAIALRLAAQYAQAVRQLRGQGTMSGKKPPSVAELVQGFSSGKHEVYDIDLERGILSLRDDADHQRAMEALDRLGSLWQRPAAPAPDAPEKPQGFGIALVAAIRNYQAVEGPGLKPDTWDGRQRALKTFTDFFGATTPVDRIARPQVAEWAAKLIEDGASKRTAVNYFSNVAQVFQFLVQQGHLTENPVKGVLVMKKREKTARKAEGFEWEAFDVDQLKRIYSPESLTQIRNVYQRWCCLIGLYTGARVSEVAQVFIQDFVEEQGIWCVRLTAESDGQSIKSESSKRLVPLHPDLIALGLLDRVKKMREAGEERLFPEVRLGGAAGRGASGSSGFSYHLTRKTVAVTARRKNGRVGFHSLRKTIVQGTGVSDERRRAFVGHEGVDDVHSTVYMRPWTAKEVSVLWEGIRWSEWLDLDAVKPLLV
jgi:integrase